MMTRSYAITLSLALLLWSIGAGAAPKPEGYTSHVEGSRVTICPMLSERGCPQAEGMLRQDLKTGQVVRLPQRCVPYVARPGVRPMRKFVQPCYVDECVPAGKYRYGYARPLDCSRSGVAYYYAQVEVQAPLAPDCRSASEPTPASRAPWNKAPVVCSRGCCRIGGAPGATEGLGLVLFAALWWWRRRRNTPPRL